MYKAIKVDKDGFLLLNQFDHWLDTRQVKFYCVRLNKDKTVTIKFYDAKKKLVRPYEQK